jgi:hypothetical protein
VNCNKASSTHYTVRSFGVRGAMEWLQGFPQVGYAEYSICNVSTFVLCL